MKKILLHILIIIVIAISLFGTKILISFINEDNKNTSSEDVRVINDIKDNLYLATEEEKYDVNKYDENVVGKLKIPKLKLEAEISEGTDLEILGKYIGHFKSTPLWNGNVGLAAHNRNSNGAHYFEGIHLLEDGDEIIYDTNMGERRYKVFNKKEISETDWSLTQNTKENILTMITCISGYPEKRLCVQAKEI